MKKNGDYNKMAAIKLLILSMACLGIKIKDIAIGDSKGGVRGHPLIGLGTTITAFVQRTVFGKNATANSIGLVDSTQPFVIGIHSRNLVNQTKLRIKHFSFVM